MGSQIEKRTTQRIEVEVPVQLEQGTGVTRDVSLSGIYFVTEEPIEEGTRIRFTMEFEYVVPGRPLHLDCSAHVLRVESQEEGLGVAARIDDYKDLEVHDDNSWGSFPGSNSLQ